MIEPLLKTQLEPVARRHRRLMLRRGLALWWAVVALAGLGFIQLSKQGGWTSPFTIPALLAAASIGAIVVWRRTRRWEPDFRQIARQIEQQHPDLHALLLTAVEQQPDPLTRQLNFLQERVIREAVAQSQRHEWIDTVPGTKLFWSGAGRLAALAALIVVVMNLRVVEKQVAIAKAIEAGITITPGDTNVEKGSGLVVLARFVGPLPPDVHLVIGATTNSLRNIPLVKSLDDPIFGGSLPEVTSDLMYHVEYGGQRTRDFKVTVFEHPRLERADARLKFPDYTSLPERKIDDTRRISAVEGTKLELTMQLNKPVASARLIARDKTEVPIAADPTKPSLTLTNFALEASRIYELQLVDADGRTNKVPAQFVIDVLKNRQPELKLASPRGDQRVSPLQEMVFQGEAWDDFGLRNYGVTYTVAGSEPQSIALGGATTPNEKRQFAYLLPLEQLAVKPDQLLSYFIWAEDVGPDGQVRRTASDMYFAEVRPFEEIFREGQSADGESSQQEKKEGQGNQSAKLAELQKQIINATWKVQRQEAGVAKPKATP
ncbi:MAG TPA: hypothetical protein VGK40_04825 [Verrucomicrobiae bacterium]|jgi:hypothetical protein